MATQPRTASAAAIASSQPLPPSQAASSPPPEGGSASAVRVTSAGEVVFTGLGVRPVGATVFAALGVGAGVTLATGVLVLPGMGEAVGVCL